MPADAGSDSALRPAEGYVEFAENVGGDRRVGLELRPGEAVLGPARHFNADASRVVETSVPGLLIEIDHVGRLGPVIVEHDVGRDLGLLLGNPAHRAVVAPFAIMNDQEIYTVWTPGREIRARSPDQLGE